VVPENVVADDAYLAAVFSPRSRRWAYQAGFGDSESQQTPHRIVQSTANCFSDFTQKSDLRGLIDNLFSNLDDSKGDAVDHDGPGRVR
jgi:hypothetical protein